MTIHVIGDSHARFCFGRLKNAKIRWLGPITMFRFGRDKARLVDKYFREFKAGDAILFVFGEIDVRCHVGRIADMTGQAREEIVQALALEYVQALAKKFANAPFKIIVCNVLPPASRPPLEENSEFPFYGTCEDRAAITRMLNAALHQQCAQWGTAVLDLHSPYATTDGYLKTGVSTDFVHVAPASAEPGVEQLRHLTGEKLELFAVDEEPVLVPVLASATKLRASVARVLKKALAVISRRSW